MALTREQERAARAFQQVTDVKNLDDKAQQKYRTIVRKAQSLIRNAGLCQALHFIESKKDLKLLNPHLQEHLGIEGNLLVAVRSMPLDNYLAATREALQCLVWQCRVVDSLLGEDS